MSFNSKKRKIIGCPSGLSTGDRHAVTTFSASEEIGQQLGSFWKYKISNMGVDNNYYFGGARSKGFATLRNVSKLQFFDKIGQAKSVGFRLYSAV